MLKGKVALVTGATRGIGLGIAKELGKAGATVFITGRTTRKQLEEYEAACEAGGSKLDPQREEPLSLGGCIEDAAEEVTKAGGKGVPLVCDHSNDKQVENVAKVIKEQAGHLHILVNNVWGGYENYNQSLWSQQVWDQPLWRWDKMINIGVRAHYVTTRFCSPLLAIEKEDFGQLNGLIVNISAGDKGKFLGCVQYDVAKYAIERLATALSFKLKPHKVAAVTVLPGLTRTERVERSLAASSKEERDAMGESHSPEFVGKAVVALAVDEKAMDKSGSALKVGQIALDYGFTDIDGSQPAPFVIPS